MQDDRQPNFTPEELAEIMDHLAAKRAAEVEEEQNSDGETTT